MQDLWLRTRIRREDYAFLGDLRMLAARSIQDVKVNWARVHLAVADRAGAWREAHPAWRMPDRMAERLDAVRQAVGTRAGVIGDALGHRTAAVGASLSAFQTVLADLRLGRLPPFPQHGWVMRAAGRVNLFSMRHLEAHHRVSEYWRRTWSAARHLPPLAHQPHRGVLATWRATPAGRSSSSGR